MQSLVLKKVCIFLSIIVPALLALQIVLSGNIFFWFDPARDLLSAWDNLSKFTLIGPPTGIPGVFYPPYWIWLLSIGLFFSKDPRLVTFIVSFIPYFIIFPFIWFRFSKLFGLKSVLIVWLLFITGTGFTYATQLWNPYPAPLITISLISLLMSLSFKAQTRRNYITAFIIGVLAGLLVSFHMSFGIAFLFGLGIYFLWEGLLHRKLIPFFVITFFVLLGFLLTLSPFFVFEARHGFHQIQALMHTFTNYGNVITDNKITGLSEVQILLTFFTTFAKLVHLPLLWGTVIVASLLGWFLYLLYKNGVTLKSDEKKLLTITSALFIGIAFIYLTARNPVWDYHFISVDILFMLLLAFLLSKVPRISVIMAGWAIIVLITTSTPTVSSWLRSDPSPLDEKKKVVTAIAQDTENKQPVIITYNEHIYSYEYTYYFRWITGLTIPYDPAQNPQSPSILYLIVPASLKKETRDDFINYRSPDTSYQTIQSWHFNEETILKRKRLH